MKDGLPPPCPELERALWRLYRDFFDQAERRRRWSLRDDIPWDQTNRQLDPAIADVVESFCAVELYLPDYTSKILPLVRQTARFNRHRDFILALLRHQPARRALFGRLASSV